MKKIENEKGTLFEVESGHFDEEQVIVQRVGVILNVYSLWITNQQQQRHRQLHNGMSLREIIDDRLSASYNWTRFLTDYRRICGLKRIWSPIKSMNVM